MLHDSPLQPAAVRRRLCRAASTFLAKRIDRQRPPIRSLSLPLAALGHQVQRQTIARECPCRPSIVRGNRRDGLCRRDCVKNVKRSLLAWENGYGRHLEDQADRVGLRYAYEGGFDVECAIEMWSRLRSGFGEKDGVTNWFDGDHSPSTDRIKNIRRELQLNYRTN